MAAHWIVEVIADNSGKWVGNGLTFDTAAAAQVYAFDLAMRWTLVRETRIVRVEPFAPDVAEYSGVTG